jgi:hypothetical protein
VIAAPLARILEPVAIALDSRIMLAETGRIMIQPGPGVFEPLMAVVTPITVREGREGRRTQQQTSAKSGGEDHSAEKLLS